MSTTQTIEFCYKWPDGRVEVRYRREEGTIPCDEMKKEIDDLINKALPQESPYFYRLKPPTNE